MKIGLLAFHQAINFGATLQLLSTHRYLLHMGLEPIVVNYVPTDLEAFYERTAPQAQRELHAELRKGLWQETALCRTSQDVAQVVEEEGIEAMIIGSDAVCQCHTLAERLTFPCRTIVGVRGTSTVESFPNAFWADWNDLLTQPIPVAIISASSQDSRYKYFRGHMREEMERLVLNYAYLSVRDEWTQKMMVHITRGLTCPEVTPDPVFAFSQNAEDLLPTREETLKKFDLPEKYVLLSFISERVVSQEWLDGFAKYARERDGVECVMLPFAQRESHGHTRKEIPLPLSPLDWYALLRYSQGYVGNNMHPIVVCLHNDTPFFSFDNYGLRRFNGLSASDRSSKIRHILESAGLHWQRVSCVKRRFTPPSAEEVYDRLSTTDHKRVDMFAKKQLERYNEMMATVLVALMD